MNGTVDMLLALIMIIGSTVGTQIGLKAGNVLKGEQLRALLGLLVLGVSSALLIRLMITPSELFVIEVLRR